MQSRVHHGALELLAAALAPLIRALVAGIAALEAREGRIAPLAAERVDRFGRGPAEARCAAADPLG